MPKENFLPSQVQIVQNRLAEMGFSGQPEGQEGQGVTPGQPGEVPGNVSRETQPPSQPQPGEDPNAADTWKDKYHVLNGKYQSEVPRLNERVRLLEETNLRLQQQNQEISNLLRDVQAQMGGGNGNRPAQSAPADPGKDIDVRKIYSDEEIEKFDDAGIDLETLKGISKMLMLQPGAPAQDNSQVQQMANEINRMKEEKAQSTEQVFTRELGRLVKDFEAIDTDPRWISWLSEPTGFPGDPRSRRQLLHANQDMIFDPKVGPERAAQHVADIFNWFKRDFGMPIEPAATPMQNPPMTPPTKQPGLENQADPVNPATYNPNNPAIPQQPQQFYTKADIVQFGADVTAGKYGRLNPDGSLPPAAQAKHDDIMRASFEGRVEGSSDGMRGKPAQGSFEQPTAAPQQAAAGNYPGFSGPYTH